MYERLSQRFSGLRHQPSWLEGGEIRLRGQLDFTIGQAQAGQPVIEITVHRKRLLRQLLQQGVLGACESYLQGDWDTEQLVPLVQLLARNRQLLDQVNRQTLAGLAQQRLRQWYAARHNDRSGSRRNILAHYDLSNDFFALFLDDNWMYSSALFQDPAQSLEAASDNKLKRICEKLELSAGDHVVEIGSGWGGFALYAARNYGCRVTTITISQAQYDKALERIRQAGLADRIDIRLCDYRDLTGQYDKLVSIEMIEAVGSQYLDTYFNCCRQLLKPGGRALIQAITIEDTRYQQALTTVDYIKRYIFPGSFIPCNTVLVRAAAQAGLRLVDLLDMGDSYALTLQHWRERFEAALPQVQALGFDMRFVRMWRLYLAYCEGGFREQVISDVQLLLDAGMPPGAVPCA